MAVQLGYLKLLLACKLHHEDIKRVSHRHLALFNLLADHGCQSPEVLVVILPVAAVELGVHESHEGLRLVHVEFQALLVVLKSLSETTFEFKHVP